MRREILFRGKRTDNGAWVEGDLRQDRDLETAYISGWSYDIGESGPEREAFEYEVDPATVCQYTGVDDKNGAKIWENDLLRYSYDYPGSPWLTVKGLTDADIVYSTGAVFWQDYRAAWAVCGHGKRCATNQNLFVYTSDPNRTEVVGNIFDNPELLVPSQPVAAQEPLPEKQ